MAHTVDLLPAKQYPARVTEWGRCAGASGPDGGRILDPVALPHPGWTGLPMQLYLLPACAQARELQVHHPSLAVAVGGRGKRRYASGRRTQDLYSSPAMLELYAEGYSIEQAQWDGVAGEVLGLQLPTPWVNRLLQAEGAGFVLPTAHERFDARVTDLMQVLWAEARAGGPHGRLYADGLSLALLGLLQQDHGAHQGTSPRRAGPRLSSAQCARLREYIDTHLGADLSVAGLAELLGMSAAYFSRAFKAAFGVSPHAYVTERRLCAACRVLQADPQAPIAGVAAGLGFASQSHFTEAFRRQWGSTPARWRAGRA